MFRLRAMKRNSKKISNQLAAQTDICYISTLIFSKQLVITDQTIKGGTNV